MVSPISEGKGYRPDTVDSDEEVGEDDERLQTVRQAGVNNTGFVTKGPTAVVLFQEVERPLSGGQEKIEEQKVDDVDCEGVSQMTVDGEYSQHT